MTRTDQRAQRRVRDGNGVEAPRPNGAERAGNGQRSVPAMWAHVAKRRARDGMSARKIAKMLGVSIEGFGGSGVNRRERRRRKCQADPDASTRTARLLDSFADWSGGVQFVDVTPVEVEGETEPWYRAGVLVVTRFHDDEIPDSFGLSVFFPRDGEMLQEHRWMVNSELLRAAMDAAQDDAEYWSKRERTGKA